MEVQQEQMFSLEKNTLCSAARLVMRRVSVTGTVTELGTTVAFQGYVSCCTVTAANVKGVTPILIEKLALISPPVYGDRRLSVLVLCTVVHFIAKRQTTLKTKRGKTKLSLTTTNKKKNLNDITMVWPDGYATTFSHA